MKLETVYPYWLLVLTSLLVVQLTLTLYAHTGSRVYAVTAGIWAVTSAMTVWHWVVEWRRERAFRRRLAAWVAESPFASIIESTVGNRLDDGAGNE